MELVSLMPFLVKGATAGAAAHAWPMPALALVPAAWPGMCLRWRCGQCTAIDRTVLLAPWGGAKGKSPRRESGHVPITPGPGRTHAKPAGCALAAKMAPPARGVGVNTARP